MKIVSIDIETTGLDPETCQILQIGAIIEDTLDVKPLSELPTYSCLVEHKSYIGSAYALQLNSGLLKKISGLEKCKDRAEYRKEHNILTPTMVSVSLSSWLANNGCEVDGEKVFINAAGKNFASFDKLFLEKLPNFTSKIKIRSRIIDPAVYATNWKEDNSIPGLKLCKERAGIEGEVTHDAVDDALDVIKVLRKFTNNYEDNAA